MDEFSRLRNADQRFRFLMSKQGNICKFTGRQFSLRGEEQPHGDHCHETLKFRGFVFSAVNRFLGAAEYIMKTCNWTEEQLCARLKEYLADPGIDIGLQAYPSDIGYATEEEAIAAYELSRN